MYQTGRAVTHSRKEDLDDIPTRPIFSEPIELLVADAVKRIGKIQACRGLANPHPGMNRLLDSERRRREIRRSKHLAIITSHNLTLDPVAQEGIKGVPVVLPATQEAGAPNVRAEARECWQRGNVSQ